MSIRAVFIIPAKADADVPAFSRKFPSVEARCKSRSGLLYVIIPPEREFVDLLLTEIGLKGGDRFNEVRDHCDKEFLNPAFQIKTKDGVLWPVIVMEHKDFIFAAVIFEDKLKIKQPSSVKLAIMASVASAIEVLNGLALCVENYTPLQGPAGVVELLKYINSAFPYGRPVCCDPDVALNFPLATWKGKIKQPAWNPIPHKGKSNITINIREEVKSIQLNKNEAKNQLGVYGCVSCSSDLEGVAPEISVVISNSPDNKCNLLVNACVSNVESITSNSTRLRFHPIKIQNVCLYKMTGINQPPIHGSFSTKIVDCIANIVVNVCLQPGVKNGFQKLEVHIPFSSSISSVKSQCSQGSLSVNSKSTLVWNIGAKLPSKSLEASLKARAKLHSKTMDKSSSTQQDDKSGKGKNVLSDISAPIKYASVIFTIKDYTYSGARIDPQSILVSSTSKVNRSVCTETSTGVYRLWNDENTEHFENDFLANELTSILQS